MVDLDTVRRLAEALPETTARTDGDSLLVEVAGKGIAWPYRAREAPRKPRVIRPGVIAIRCALARKELLMQAAPHAFFEDDHYRGYPAVLVRLAEVDAAEIASLLEEGWRIQAPKALVKRHRPDG